MNAPAHFVVLFGLLAIASCSCTNAPAGFISGSVSGPGGTGTSGVTIPGGNSAIPDLTFTSLDYLDVSYQVDAAGALQIGGPIVGIRNHTGQTWGGFSWQIISGPGTSFPINGLYFNSPQPWTIAVRDTCATFSGQTLPSSGVNNMAPSFSITVTGPGTFVIRETPIAVPEPSTSTLAGLGVLAMLAFNRRNVR